MVIHEGAGRDAGRTSPERRAPGGVNKKPCAVKITPGPIPLPGQRLRGLGRGDRAGSTVSARAPLGFPANYEGACESMKAEVGRLKSEG